MEEKKPRPVKKPDPHAKRFTKHEFSYKVVNRDLYVKWKKETGNRLTYKEFVDIWDQIIAVVREKIVTTVHGVRLPFFNGDISTNYVNMLRRHINHQASNNLGYEVPELDWHSNKRKGKICYSINHARRQHRWLILFAFAPYTELKEEAAEGLKKHPEIYRLARTMAYVAYKQAQK